MNNKSSYPITQQAYQQVTQTQYPSVSQIMLTLPNLGVEQLQSIFDILKPLLKERYIERLAKLDEEI